MSWQNNISGLKNAPSNRQINIGSIHITSSRIPKDEIEDTLRLFSSRRNKNTNSNQRYKNAKNDHSLRKENAELKERIGILTKTLEAATKLLESFGIRK